MYSSFNQKLKNSLSCQLGSSAIALVVALTGFALTSSAVVAGAQTVDYIQVAALDSEKQSANKTDESMDNLAMDDESEIGAVAVAEDTKLGAFSMEDGAMLGVYGDGEYAD